MLDTSKLAQSITRSSSIQTYYTAVLMVDRDLVDDFFRAYAYFRWVDDFIDIHSTTTEERLAFIERQKDLIDLFYSQGTQDGLSPQEQIVEDLIQNDRDKASGLQSFIRNMMAIIEFDAIRKDGLISQDELDWYTERLGISVTDGIQYFVGNGHPYPQTDQQYLAATGAHIAHLLRDMRIDVSDGFVNIPSGVLEKNNLQADSYDQEAYQAWIAERVRQARVDFLEGKKYLDSLEVLRCKIVGYWYCARFEGVLDAIERDDYSLRDSYDVRKSPSAWLRIFWIWISVTVRHGLRKLSGGLSEE